MHGFRVLNNEINACFNADSFAKSVLDLLVDAEKFIDRHPSPVHLYDIDLLRGNLSDIIPDLFVKGLVVDGNGVERLIENIPQDHRGPVELTEYFKRWFGLIQL